MGHAQRSARRRFPAGGRRAVAGYRAPIGIRIPSTPTPGTSMTSPINPNPVTEDDAAAQLKAQRLRKRRLLLRGLVALVVVVGIGWALYHFLVGRWYEGTDDAYVDGNVVQITPQVPGTVISIGADDNDYVRQGQTLVKLDPSDADVALAQAEAALAQAVRKVRGLYSTVHTSKADVAAREIGRASCRERVEIPVGAGALKEK